MRQKSDSPAEPDKGDPADTAAGFQRLASSVYAIGSVHGLVRDKLTCEAVAVYFEQLLEQAGNPQDPIERMVIEQIVLAFHNIGRLYIKANCAKTVQEAEVYNAAAARLLGEFRRTALALKEYRSPSAPHKVVIGQQNLAAGDQQIALVAPPGPAAPENLLNGELCSPPPEALIHERQSELVFQLEADDCPETEPLEARPAHARRPRKAPRHRPAE